MVLGTGPSASGLAEFNLVRSARGAHNLAVWPAPNSKIINAVVWVGEVDNSFLKTLRFGFHGGFHEQNYSLKPWSSQLYYCPPPVFGIMGLEGLFSPKYRTERTYFSKYSGIRT
jgi:hypothetical protein